MSASLSPFFKVQLFRKASVYRGTACVRSDVKSFASLEIISRSFFQNDLMPAGWHYHCKKLSPTIGVKAYARDVAEADKDGWDATDFGVWFLSSRSALW